MILFLRLGWETKVPLVLSEGFDIVEVGNDVLKKFGWANFEFCEIHRCPEGAEIGSRQLTVEF